jgi:hypothetical protein
LSIGFDLNYFIGRQSVVQDFILFLQFEEKIYPWPKHRQAEIFKCDQQTAPFYLLSMRGRALYSSNITFVSFKWPKSFSSVSYMLGIMDD